MFDILIIIAIILIILITIFKIIQDMEKFGSNILNQKQKSSNSDLLIGYNNCNKLKRMTISWIFSENSFDFTNLKYLIIAHGYKNLSEENYIKFAQIKSLKHLTIIKRTEDKKQKRSKLFCNELIKNNTLESLCLINQPWNRNSVINIRCLTNLQSLQIYRCNKMNRKLIKTWGIQVNWKYLNLDVSKPFSHSGNNFFFFFIYMHVYLI